MASAASRQTAIIHVHFVGKRHKAVIDISVCVFNMFLLMSLAVGGRSQQIRLPPRLGSEDPKWRGLHFVAAIRPDQWNALVLPTVAGWGFDAVGTSRLDKWIRPALARTEEYRPAPNDFAPRGRDEHRRVIGLMLRRNGVAVLRTRRVLQRLNLRERRLGHRRGFRPQI